MNEQSIKPIIESLEDLFSKFNARFYGGALQMPVIVVNSKGKRPAYGWCTCWKAWSNDENADENEGYYEICITSEYLNREPEEVAETMLHEMVHLYCAQNDIQDCSRSGLYHNKKYQITAEAHGLIVSKTEKCGWAETGFNEDAKRFFATLNWEGFSLFRRSDEANKTKKSSVRVYTCPVCSAKVRATKHVNIRCMDCDEEMICLDF